MNDSVNKFDVAFIVDTTASMGPFLEHAKKRMIDLIETSATDSEASLRVGIVEYRDHPPQDVLVFQTFDFTGDLRKVRRTIESLRPDGGGDGPESVLDGVLAACVKLRWDAHAYRVAVLVGDAPPHGVGARGDGFPEGWPCGQTIDTVTVAAEEQRITLFAIPLTHAAQASFQKLASFTGGRALDPRDPSAAVDEIDRILTKEFGNLKFDAAVLKDWNEHDDWTVDSAAERLAASPGEIALAAARLSARRLLD